MDHVLFVNCCSIIDPECCNMQNNPLLKVFNLSLILSYRILANLWSRFVNAWMFLNLLLIHYLKKKNNLLYSFVVVLRVMSNVNELSKGGLAF